MSSVAILLYESKNLIPLKKRDIFERQAMQNIWVNISL